MTGREGRLSWETRAEEVSFEVLPKRCNRGTISYMERKRVPKGRGIVTEGNLKRDVLKPSKVITLHAHARMAMVVGKLV